MPDNKILEPCSTYLHGLYNTDSIRNNEQKIDTKIQFSGRDAISEDINKIYHEWGSLLGGEAVSMRLLSGLHAHTVVFMGLTSIGDHVVILPEVAGGHMATKAILQRLGLIVHELVVDFCHEKEYEIASYIDETVLNHAKFIGEGNIIMDNVRLDYDCEIGDGNYIGHDATVAHDVKIGNFNYISGRTGFGGSVFLGDYNFLGMSSLIANDIKLGDMNLIGAGAYVRHSLCTHMVVTPAQERIVQTEDRMLMWMLKNH